MKLRLVAALLLVPCALQFAASQNGFWMPTNGPGASYDVRSLAVNSSGVVFAGTWTDGSIWKTTDDGSAWTECGSMVNPGPVLWISVNSRDHLFASAYGGGMYRSTDGGATWVQRDSGLAALTVRTSLVDKGGNIWVANEQGLYRSTNNGDSWSMILSGYFYNVFLDSSAAIETEDAVLLYRSTDQGASWTTHPFSGYSFLGVHPDGSYIAGSVSSQIFRSTDLGASWKDLHTGVSWSGGSWAATFDRRGDIFYSRSGSSGGILASIDTGKTWNVVNSGLPSTFVLPLLVHPKGYVYLGTGGNGVYRTRYTIDSSMTPSVFVQPGTLNFGSVEIGIADSLSLTILNAGLRDSLRIGSLSSTSSRFTIRIHAAVVPPDGSITASIIYAPTVAATDTGTILISTNDPRVPVYAVPVLGKGLGLAYAPQIERIDLIPNNYSQARVTWLRSISDSAGAADQVTQYSVWRRVLTPGNQPARVPLQNVVAPAGVATAWDFIVTVPAVGLNEYAAIVPVPYVSSSVPPWYVFIVVAQTAGLKVYTSAPDSVQDPSPLTGVSGGPSGQVPDELVLRQNYPNPFNPSTTFRYGLPSRIHVTMAVYNTLGQCVATLVNETQDAGYHDVRFDGTGLASGVYFSRLIAGENVDTKKMLLLK